MNLFDDGPESAATWLLDRILDFGAEVALHMGSHGGLFAVYADTHFDKPGYELVGTYGPGLQHAEALEDLRFLARTREKIPRQRGPRAVSAKRRAA
jgi:hypothetical protein